MAARRHLVCALEDGIEEQVSLALWMLQESRRRTVQALEGLDELLLDWRPDRGANSIAALLYHIAAIEMDWLYCEVLEREVPEEVLEQFPWDVRDGRGRLSQAVGRSLTEHLGLLDRTRSLTMRHLRELESGEWHRPRVLESYRVSPCWVVMHLAQHEAEHRGQIRQIRLATETAN